MLRQAARRILPAQGRTMSTAASATVVADAPVQSYVSSSPAAEVTVLDNGVTVASVFDEGSASPARISTRISSLGSRSSPGSALLASALGGVSGREHVLLPGAPSLASAAGADLEGLKASLAAGVANADYDSQMMDQLHSTAFQGQSLGNLLVGTAEDVAALSASDVEAAAAGVNGGSVVVVGTGGGSHDGLVEMAAGAYGKLEGGAGGSEVATVGESAAFIGSDVRIRYDSHKTATVALAFEGASHADPKQLPLALMTHILGSYSSADGLGKNVAPAMCQEVADHGLASKISAFSLNYSDTGLFGVVATAPDNKLDDLMWYVMPNLVRLAHGISDQELARAKLALKVSVLSSHDGDAALAETMAAQLSTIGRVVPLSEMLARVDALTMDDVKAAANDVINDQDHALAAIGGIHELPDYNWIRRHSYMLRY